MGTELENVAPPWSTKEVLCLPERWRGRKSGLVLSSVCVCVWVCMKFATHGKPPNLSTGLDLGEPATQMSFPVHKFL